ncbi:MAG: hypothetical protein ACI9JK_001116 [Phycisphaerales bacterium]|jgi:hypothetical protein
MEKHKKISVVDPITPAWNHMVLILFKPFEFKKWLTLGFCAFLSQCSEGGGSGFNYFPKTGNTYQGMYGWIENNFSTFITIACLALFAILALIFFLVWISSRGNFMLIDGIVKNRGAISEPWNEYKREGNSLCLFSICLMLLYIIVFVVLGASSFAIAIPDVQSQEFTGFGIAAIVVGSIFLLLYILASVFVAFFVKIFVIPTMYIKRISAMEAWKIAWVELHQPNRWSSVLLLLMVLLFSLGAGFTAMFAVCATCCIGALPYVSSVLLLPIAVFFTCYSLCYIQQFGAEWTFFRNMCRFCSYDMHGLEEGHSCPECGKS